MHFNEIKRVLISVTDKGGIIEFARGLSGFGIEILSTGGTAAQLRANGIPVREVSDYTGYPEMMDGRLKTLHPKIHGGLLALRDNPDHMEAVKKHEIDLIDMVIINLYRFEDTVAKPGCSLDDAIENIDIGGPTMLRAAAKNYRFVSVVTSPLDYKNILEELQSNKGKISEATNFQLAVKTFQLTARYDAAISNYLGKLLPDCGQKDFPDVFTIQFSKAQDLRYGENPHQKAIFYRETETAPVAITGARQIQGKELSYNNIMDSDAAWQAICDFNEPAAVIMKHANPCGASVAGDLKTAYINALKTDPVSAFGGIVAFNRSIDKDTAAELAKIFLEVIIAPGFEPEAIEILGKKQNLRLLQVPSCEGASVGMDFRRVVGGLLVQQRDTEDIDLKKAQVATKRAPTQDEYKTLDFAWRVVKHVKSNAIVLANNDQLVGVGAGQMSRVDSTKLAISKSNISTRGTVLASDAFFPFRDVVDLAAEAGVTAIVQPGGSIRDDESIKAADSTASR